MNPNQIAHGRISGREIYMQTKWLKGIAMAVVAGTLGVLALGAIASAQGPTPTNPATPTVPNSQTAPNNNKPKELGDVDNFGRGQKSLITAFATALGMAESDLLTQLQAGQSVGELALEKNVNTATVISAYLKPYQDALTTAVTNKQFTQAQADARVAVRKADAEAFLDYKYDPNQVAPRGLGDFGGFGLEGDRHGGRGGHDKNGQPEQQEQQPQQQPEQQPTPSGL